MALTAAQAQAFNNLTIDQLLDLNKAIVARVKHLRANQQWQAARRFDVGDYACFWSPKKGRHVYVRIDKINNVTVGATEVDRETGAASFMKWRVAPSMLYPWQPENRGRDLPKGPAAAVASF